MNIKRVLQSEEDKDLIFKLPRPSEAPPKVNWSDFIVNKPWGYEYLVFSCPDSEAWSLFIRHNAATSMHCHPKKKTALLVLDGIVQFSTLKEAHTFNQMDSVIIDPGVFHQTRAIAPEGAHVIEIETPPAKHDLLRLRDEYGRAGKPYEGLDQMSLHESQRVRFSNPDQHPFQERNFHNICKLAFKKINQPYTLQDGAHLNNYDLAVLLDGSILHKDTKQTMHSVADVMATRDFLNGSDNYAINNPVSLFLISPEKYG